MPTPVIADRAKESAPATAPGVSPAVAPRGAMIGSTAFVAFVLFIALNWLSTIIEPGAYYVNTRKCLNMPEKVGMFLLRKPHPDLLFMGSSRPCLGFDTTVAQEQLDKQHLPHKMMNMSVVATSFDFNNILLKNWILPNNPPKVIVYGCSEFDLFGCGVGEKRYRSIWRNMPYTHTLSRLDDWAEYTEAEFTEQVEFVLDQGFPMIRDRKLFRDALIILCKLYPIPLDKHPKDYLSKPSNEFTEKEVADGDYNYRRYLPAYDMTDPNVADMERFISMAQAKHIKLIFVNMPVAEKFRSYWRDYKHWKITRYRQLLAQIAKKHDIPLVDYYVAPPEIFDPKTAFRDTNHLSKFGAKIITEKIMNEQVIPLLQRK